MIVEDFICLGRTVPEQSKKYGQKVCMAGYSPELGQLMRVYPLPVCNPLRSMHSYVLSLTRNSGDSRRESWKLSDRVALYESHETVSAERIRTDLRSMASDSIDDLNSNRASLGVIMADYVQLEFTRREHVKLAEQLELFESTEEAFGADAAAVAPYLVFDDACGRHRLQLREWGCYEWVRKHPGRHRELADNLQTRDPSKRHVLLVGNMANRRNVWLVIKTWAVSHSTQLSLIGGS